MLNPAAEETTEETVSFATTEAPARDTPVAQQIVVDEVQLVVEQSTSNDIDAVQSDAPNRRPDTVRTAPPLGGVLYIDEDVTSRPASSKPSVARWKSSGARTTASVDHLPLTTNSVQAGHFTGTPATQNLDNVL